MINMSSKQQIIIGYFQHGKSQRKLARELGLNRRTVQRYIEQHQQQYGAHIPPAGVTVVPTYPPTKRRKRKLTTTITALIDEQLQLNAEKRRTGRRKLVLKGTDIHALLVEQGHAISYPTVINYIRQKQQGGKAAFIRQDYQAGESVQFDWGEVRLELNGKTQRLQLAVFTCAYSNYRWAQLYWRQDMCSFLHAHSAFFQHIGGVSAEVVYDNLRTAVAKFAQRHTDKEPTQDLLRLSTYYGFQYRFCNARAGHEKGQVERSVEVVRRKVFGRKATFDSLAQANQYLSEKTEALHQQTTVKGKTQTIAEQFVEEQAALLPHPITPFDAGTPKRLRVNKYSCIQVDNNFYSVPDHLVGQHLEVKVYPQYIKVYYADNQYFTHVRRITKFEFYLKIEHYLSTLQRKPGALNGSVALRQADDVLQTIYQQHFKNRPKIFLELLLLLNLQAVPQRPTYSPLQLQRALDKCLHICPHQAPQLDKIQHFLTQPTEQLVPPKQPPREQPCDAITRQARQQLQAVEALLHPS